MEGCKLLTGTINAKVLPDPVFAAPRTSLPCKAKPMVCLCISVTTRYWASCNPSVCSVGRESSGGKGDKKKKGQYLKLNLKQ